MTLTKKEKSYIDNAYLRLEGDIDKFTEFLKNNFSGQDSRIKEMLIYFNELKEKEVSKNEEEAFKKKVMDYNDKKEKIKKKGFKEKMKFKKEYRDVIKWMNQVKKFTEVYNNLLNRIKEKRKEINEEDLKKQENENENARKLKGEMIEPIMNANAEVLVVNDPNTGEEVTYGSLESCSIDQLIEIMENNVYELNSFLNKGRIEE